MRTRSLLIIFILALMQVAPASAQGLAIGQWRDHLPYQQCIALADGGDVIYCATPHSLFLYADEDNSIERLNKVTGLSDIGISTIAYSKTYNTLLIAYSNANIDLIKDNRIINISDIKRKPILGVKSINEVTFIDNLAYLSCGFGVVVLDIVREEIKDTYYIGPGGSAIQTYDLTTDGDTLWVATEAGIAAAPVNASNLANYASWTYLQDIPHPDVYYNDIEYFQGRLFANYHVGDANNEDTLWVRENGQWTEFFQQPTYNACYDIRVSNGLLVLAFNYFVHAYDDSLNQVKNVYSYFTALPPFPRQAFVDEAGYVWIADDMSGLVQFLWDQDINFVKPYGPGGANSYDMDYQAGRLWVVSGGRTDTWAPLYLKDGVYSFIEEDWISYNRTNTLALDSVSDYMSVAVNPFDPDNVFVGTWGYGIIEFNNGVISNFWNETNSSLVKDQYGFLGVAGLAFDQQGNLWVTNTSVTQGLSVFTPSGVWQGLNLSPYVNQATMGDLIIDDYGQKWVELPRSGGILVYDDNGTPTNTADDKKYRMTNVIGGGNLPNTHVNTLAKDDDGEIWVGTEEGIAVFYSPENVFVSGADFDAQQILVEEGGFVAPLLEAEVITCIVVDGSNKKWVGTQRSGAYLLSEDGTEQLLHLTEENSPLFSNTILSICINEETGEVFFGTAKGLISYKGKATTGGDEHSDVFVYPNPVPESYNGWIAIRGLVTNADVKITDISGNLVFQTRAEGGQAVWNGKDFEGNRAHTGVYLVFSSNEDGSETLVSKILFIH